MRMLWGALKHQVVREVLLVLAGTFTTSALVFKSLLPGSLAFFLYTLVPLNLFGLRYASLQHYREKAKAQIALDSETQTISWKELTEPHCPATQERYVVVGGSGFVGQRIVHALRLRGEKHVLVIDLDEAAMQTMRTRYNADDGLHPVQFLRADVTKREEIFQALRGAECVFAPFALIRFWEHLSKHYSRSSRVNVEGMRNVCDACVEFGVKRLIVTSSSAATEPYGGTLVEGFDEDTPRVSRADYASNYALSKSESEALALSYNSPTLHVASIRPSSAVFGYGDKLALSYVKSGFYPLIFPSNVLDYVHVDSVVLAQLLCEAKLRVPGNAVQGKAFCIKGDAVEEAVFCGLLEHYAPGVKAQLLPGRLVLCLGAAISLLQVIYPGDLISLLGRDLGMLSLPTFFTATKQYLYRTRESERAKTLLGYSPHKSLSASMEQTLREMREDRVIME